jgi:hypothetical protein
MIKDTSSKSIGGAAKQPERNMSSLVNTMKDTRGKKPRISASRPKSKPSARSEVTLDRIRCRAYEIYCDRSGARVRGGDHVSDWLQAERELTNATKSARVGVRSGGHHQTYDRSEVKPQSRCDRVVHAVESACSADC